MSSSLRDRSRRTALAAAVALLLSSCASVHDALVVDKPPPRVSFKGYAIDLAYGKDPAPPAADSGVAELFNGFADVFLELPGEDVVYDPGTRRVRPVEPLVPCPEPGPDVVAERPITTDVKIAPEPGVYRYKQSGTEQIVGLANLKVDGLHQRTLRNVRANPLGGWDYDIDYTVGLLGVSETLRVVPASATPNGQGVGAGLQLVNLTLKASSGATVFNPLVPVTIFPLPATEQSTVNGAGVDPVNGTGLVVGGTITKKDRIDGCDEVADGWTADTTWTFVRAGRAPVTWTYSYTVATQHGALIIGDHLKTTDTVGPFAVVLDITSAFGNIHPAPEKK